MATPEYRPIKVTLKDDPKGEDLGQVSLHTFTLTDAFVLKNNTGLTFNQMVAGLDQREPESLRALAWFMKFKRGDQMPVESIEFPLANLSWEVLPNPTKARSGKSARATSDSSPSSAD